MRRRTSKGASALRRILKLSGQDVLVVKGTLDTFVGEIRNRSFEIELADGEVEKINTKLIDVITFKNPAQPKSDRMYLAAGVLSGTILTDPIKMRTLGRDKRFRTSTVAGISFLG